MADEFGNETEKMRQKITNHLMSDDQHIGRLPRDV